METGFPLSDSTSGGSALLTAEPGSRRLHRQQGAPQRPPHQFLAPRGPGTSSSKALGPDVPRGRPQPPGTPREHPSLQQLSEVVKHQLAQSPSSAFPPPEAAKKGQQSRSPRQVGDGGRGCPGSPPPPVTCEDSDTDLMVVVGEDHSLGRHVSQRSHCTDRSREKPESGARGPGARSPQRARSGRGRRPRARRPVWDKGPAGSARVRGSGRSQGARPRVRVGGR